MEEIYLPFWKRSARAHLDPITGYLVAYRSTASALTNSPPACAEHRVPLTSRSVAILEHVQFLGHGRPFPISNMAMEMLLRRMDQDDFTVHGFRSSFRDWAGEETEFPREIAEAALAHQVGNAVERAYRRGDALEKRRELMRAWEAYLTQPGAEPGTQTDPRA